MIIWSEGNLFLAPANICVVTTNCVGVAGKGVALEAKQRFPEWYYRYRKAYSLGRLKPGQLVWHTMPQDSYFNFMISFNTKDHWRDPSKLEWIESGLQQLVSLITETDEPAWSVAMTLPGAGNGGLNPYVVQKLVIKYLNPIINQIYVYGAPR